jgi:hypothetical protein
MTIFLDFDSIFFTKTKPVLKPDENSSGLCDRFAFAQLFFFLLPDLHFVVFRRFVLVQAHNNLQPSTSNLIHIYHGMV